MNPTNPTVVRLQGEHLSSALGLGHPRPRLSWQTTTTALNWMQTAYCLETVPPQGTAAESTGRVASAQSVLVDWPFAPLASREVRRVRVKVWGASGESPWSEPLTIEAGLLSPSDWSARFITPAAPDDGKTTGPSPQLRTEFTLGRGIALARLYATALGLYETRLNGHPAGDQVLAPGWTSYHHRLRYQTYDVTPLVREGPNAWGATLAEGWYRGRIGFEGGKRAIWGTELAFLGQLEVTYTDGSRQVVVTGPDWTSHDGPVRFASLYDGERYDARRETPGWDQCGFTGVWAGTRVVPRDLSTLVAPVGPPVRRIQTLAPVAITTSPAGKTLVDFGQNLVGWLRITVTGTAGQTVTLRHAEVLEHGELGTRPLRKAECTDTYTLRGGGVETWEPRFTTHGFRYAEVTGWPGTLKPGDLEAVVVHSDLERTGWFDSSDPLLNRLHENVVWSMKGNFVDVPTDCPQRDERLGWTGDLQMFSPTATFLHSVNGFLGSWLADLAAEQAHLGGAVPFVVPDALSNGSGTAAWSDAAVIVPWVLYQRTGDTGVLAAQFDSMKAWVDYVGTRATPEGLWNHGFQFGDWLDPTAPPDKPWLARTDKSVVASAYYAYSLRLVAAAAAVLGRTEDHGRYQALADKVKDAFSREFVTPSGRLVYDAETAYALALGFDLIPSESQRQRAGLRLAELVREGGYRIRTGFVGTPLILDALCSTGHFDAAWRLFRQKEAPSWLYAVLRGGTTVWERWDSMLPDGSINPGEMTSFNHYAFGAVADWMHRVVGGLDAAEPGYRRLRVAPRPGPGLSRASASHLTPYGRAEVAWSVDGAQFALKLTVPPNATAEVHLPDGQRLDVGSGTWTWTVSYTDPRAGRGPSVDDLVGDLLCETPLREALFATLDALKAPGYLKGVLGTDPHRPLRAALEILPDPETAARAVEHAFAHLKETV